VPAPLAERPDWRDAGPYAPLLKLERPGFAWEFLRRDPSYRAAALEAFRTRPTATPRPEWGLHAFEHPDRAAPDARPVWREDVLPFILPIIAVDQGPSNDRLDVGALRGLATLARMPGGREHLLISDGFRSIRLDVVGGTLADGPVSLVYQLTGFDRLEPPLLVLRQLLALIRQGDFSPGLHRADRRAHRWVALLRARDAIDAGAGQREIAARLMNPDAAGPRWRVESPALRSRVQRLVRQASLMERGGYRALLAAPGQSRC